MLNQRLLLFQGGLHGERVLPLAADDEELAAHLPDDVAPRVLLDRALLLQAVRLHTRESLRRIQSLTVHHPPHLHRNGDRF
jgi:hypothetical protein